MEKQSMMSSHSEQVQQDLEGLGCCPTVDVSHAHDPRTRRRILIEFESRFLSPPMYIHEPTCFLLAPFQVPGLAPDCLLRRHEASERVLGHFPARSRSRSSLPYLRLTSGDVMQSTKNAAFPLNKCIICSAFRVKYERGLLYDEFRTLCKHNGFSPNS